MTAPGQRRQCQRCRQEHQSDGPGSGVWMTCEFYSTILYGANAGDPYPRFADGTYNMSKIIPRLLRRWPDYLEKYMPKVINEPEQLAQTKYYYRYLKNKS